jgi:hypothetical protein
VETWENLGSLSLLLKAYARHGLGEPLSNTPMYVRMMIQLYLHWINQMLPLLSPLIIPSQPDISFVKNLERVQIYCYHFRNYGITNGRPNLEKFIEEMNNIEA